MHHHTTPNNPLPLSLSLSLSLLLLLHHPSSTTAQTSRSWQSPGTSNTSSAQRANGTMPYGTEYVSPAYLAASLRSPYAKGEVSFTGRDLSQAWNDDGGW